MKKFFSKFVGGGTSYFSNQGRHHTSLAQETQALSPPRAVADEVQKNGS